MLKQLLEHHCRRLESACSISKYKFALWHHIKCEITKKSEHAMQAT